MYILHYSLILVSYLLCFESKRRLFAVTKSVSAAFNKIQPALFITYSRVRREVRREWNLTQSA